MDKTQQTFTTNTWTSAAAVHKQTENIKILKISKILVFLKQILLSFLNHTFHFDSFFKTSYKCQLPAVYGNQTCCKLTHFSKAFGFIF